LRSTTDPSALAAIETEQRRTGACWILARRLRGWLAAMPAAVGFGTLRAILKLWMGFPPSRSGVRSAGNGAGRIDDADATEEQVDDERARRR
jgi:hypothetical protein